jgi:hypothetical protein
MAYTYGHKRLDKNEFFYIGIGSDTNHERANKKNQRTKYWHNIVNKADYEVIIIEDNLSWEEACEREKYWIKFYGRKDLQEGNLVNLTDGGEGTIGIKRGESYKIKQRAAQCGRKLSDETRRKISEAKKGKKHKPHSEETKQKIRESKIGTKRTTEQRKKMSIAHIGLQNGDKNGMFGKSHSEETKQKISIAKTGKKHKNPMSEETKKRISIAKTGKKLNKIKLVISNNLSILDI